MSKLSKKRRVNSSKRQKCLVDVQKGKTALKSPFPSPPQRNHREKANGSVDL